MSISSSGQSIKFLFLKLKDLIFMHLILNNRSQLKTDLKFQVFTSYLKTGKQYSMK